MLSCYPSNRSLTNWSENIKSKSSIKYPKDDAQLISYIQEAKQNSQIIRVVGSAHAMSPLVSDLYESDLLLISLKQYQLQPQNILIDHTKLTVIVNAGWKLGQLYDHLTSHNLYLQTQPASPAFTIGGLVAAPVHGSRLGKSFVSDTVAEITFIDDKGNKVTKDETDPNWAFYRLNLGLCGVIISVTFKLAKLRGFDTHIQSFYNLFYCDSDSSTKIKRSLLNDFFKHKIDLCFSSCRAYYTHCFIDFHNRVLMAVDWIEKDEFYPINDLYPEAEEVYKFQPLEALFSKVSKAYRTSPSFLRLLGTVTRQNIALAVEKNIYQDMDMFWVSSSPRVFFMSYLIPVAVKGESYQIEKLYQALEFIMNLIETFKSKRRSFTIDLPADLRFVNSSSSLLSGIYSRDTTTVYAAIEIVTTAYNLTVNGDSSTDLNREFRRFFTQVETKFKELGGIPHLGKLHGFDKSYTPFQDLYVYSPEIKLIAKSKASHLFTNRFVDKLINY